jgi:hypothetical protein
MPGALFLFRPDGKLLARLPEMEEHSPVRALPARRLEWNARLVEDMDNGRQSVGTSANEWAAAGPPTRGALFLLPQ